MNYIPDAKEAVEQEAGCEAIHVETVAVLEMLNEEAIWKGSVEVFSLSKRPPALGYSWVEGGTKGGKKYIAVLGTGSIDSPQTALRAWLDSR